MTSSRNCSSTKHRVQARHRFVLLGCFFSLQSVLAGEVLESYVGSEGDHFRVHIDMLIDAHPEQVRELLTDYAHLDRLSPSITDSQLIYSNTPHYRVRVTNTFYNLVYPFFINEGVG